MTKNIFLTGRWKSNPNDDFIDQHRLIKNELSEYIQFINEIKDKWTDKKKDEFFRVHIERPIIYAENYLKRCELLITKIEIARNIKEI